MALQSCSECGQQVSDKADACPHCGAPQVVLLTVKKKKKNRKPWFIAGAVALVLLLGLAVRMMSFPARVADVVSPTDSPTKVHNWQRVLGMSEVEFSRLCVEEGGDAATHDIPPAFAAERATMCSIDPLPVVVAYREGRANVWRVYGRADDEVFVAAVAGVEGRKPDHAGSDEECGWQQWNDPRSSRMMVQCSDVNIYAVSAIQR